MDRDLELDKIELYISADYKTIYSITDLGLSVQIR